MQDKRVSEQCLYNNLFHLIGEQIKHLNAVIHFDNELLNLLPVGVLICKDLNCSNLKPNAKAAEFLRLDDSQALFNFTVDNQLLKLLHEGRLIFAEEMPIQRSIVFGEYVDNVEIDLIWEDGVQKSSLWTSRPLHDNAGNKIGAVAIFEDITELKRLREKDLHLRMATEDGAFGTYTYYFLTGEGWSPDLKDFWNLNYNQPARAKTDNPYTGVHPDDRSPLLAALKAASNPQGDGRLAMDYRILSQDGSITWLRVQGQTVFTMSGEERIPLWSAGVVMDITHRVKTAHEARLREIRLDALTKLHSDEFWQQEDPNKFVLKTVLLSTGSKMAYFCRVHRNQEIAYNRMLAIKPEGDIIFRSNNDHKPLKDLEVIGPFVGDSAPVLSNDINIVHPELGQITNLAIVPIFGKKLLQAIIAVANKSTAYSPKDQQHLQLFLQGFMDIVLRKDAEGRALEQEHYFKSLMENSLDMICVLSSNTDICFISNSVRDILGYELEQLIGKNLYSVLRPANSQLAKQLLDEIDSDKGISVSTDIEMVTKHGSPVLLEVKAQGVDLPDRGRFILINARDATASRKAEQKLKEALYRYAMLISSAADAIILVDAETGVIIEVNEAAERLTGIPMDQLVGKHYYELHPPELHEEYRAYFKERATAEQDVLPSVERVVAHSDGTIIPVEISTARIDVDGRRVMQGIFRNISERKFNEKYQIQLQVEAATREAQRKVIEFKKLAAQSVGLGEVLYSSPKMLNIVEEARKYNQDRSISVLILGETGTGKEVIARLIHYGDLDIVDSPFVAVNCAAVNRQLFESEFFGYEAGSFTGGLKGGQIGKFDSAKGGTIFLDEISEIPLDLQSKLLRVIDSREFYRVGGNRPVATDVRIVCASNVDLNYAVNNGTFRKDLYYRLCVGLINIPPLRERGQEIIDLALHFLKQFSRQKGKKFDKIHYQAAHILSSYSWPGNVRELKNLMEWITFMYDDEVLLPQYLEKLVDVKFQSNDSLLTLNTGGEITLDLILQALETAKGNKQKAANLLGISRPTLYKYIKLYKV